MTRERELVNQNKPEYSFFESHPKLSRQDVRLTRVSHPEIFQLPPIYFLEQAGEFLNQEELEYCNRFSRNLGFLSIQEQLLLLHSTIAIAGCGAEGSTIAKRLVQSGIGTLILADNDVFEVTNVNRQEGAGEKTVGLNKAIVAGEIACDLNPNINLHILKEGINDVTIRNLVNADLIVEEVDYKEPLIVLAVHDFAREHKIPTITSISVGFGFRIYYVNYRNSKTMGFREFIGFSNSASMEEIRHRVEEINIFKFCPRIPSYIPQQVLKSVAIGGAAPVITEGVNLGAAYTSYLIKDVLLGNDHQPKELPWIYCFDAKTSEFGLVNALNIPEKQSIVPIF